MAVVIVADGTKTTGLTVLTSQNRSVKMQIFLELRLTVKPVVPLSILSR